AKTTIPKAVAKVNIPYLNTLNTRRGSSNFNCLEINKKSDTDPTAVDIPTCGLIQPISPAILKPYKSPPNPNVDKMTDKISSLGFFNSVTFFSKKYAAMMSKMAIGNTTRKTLRHGN